MSKNYQRFDYPAQCFNVTAYGDFVKRCDTTNSDQLADFKVLIVANELELLDKFNSLFKLVCWFGGLCNSVDVLYLEKETQAVATWSSWLSEKKISTVNFRLLPNTENILQSPIADALGHSFQFDSWLAHYEQDYSLVFAYDCLSVLYYPLMKKNMGCSYSQLPFIAFARSTTWFDTVKASAPIYSPNELNEFYAQERVLSTLDAFISNRFELLIWLSEQYGSEVRQRACFANLAGDEPKTLVQRKQAVALTEFVFVFTAKDFRQASLCIEALASVDRSNITTTFILPKVCSKELRTRVVEHDLSGRVLVKCCQSENVYWSHYAVPSTAIFIPSSEFISANLLNYLRCSDALILDNDVFIDKGRDEASMRVFHHNPSSIKALIDRLLRFNEPDELINQIQLSPSLLFQLSKSCDESDRLERVRKNKPVSVSVCISHCNRGELLLRAVNSIKQQTRPCQELVIIDDGSTDRYALEVLDDLEMQEGELTIKVVRQEKSFIGASRNSGLEAVTSDYVMFMDDDNEAKPKEIETFLEAALYSNADILTCLSEVFAGDSPKHSSINLQHALFVGANSASSLFSNPFGDSNMFAKVERIREIGGFSEYYRVGRDDHEFFVRASNAGLRLELLPVALYYYRINEKRIRHTHINQYAGPARVAQTFSQPMSSQHAQMVRYAQSLSYAVGPFGVNSTFVAFKLRVIESLRIYMAKFPGLYRFLKKVRAWF